MKVVKEIIRKINQAFVDKTPTYDQRRLAIHALPVDPNGTIFSDYWEAQVYKTKLTVEGYLVIEGTTTDGLPHLRPQTMAEFEAVDKFFNQKSINRHQLAGILDEFNRKAKAGELTDVPLYRKPHQDNQ